MATLLLTAIVPSSWGAVGIGAATMIGSMIDQAIFSPKPPVQERGKVDDLRVTGSSYGSMIPLVYGTARIGGNLIWSTDLVEHVEEQGGKKGMGKGPSVKDYTYSCQFAIAVCEGPVTNISRIAADDLVVYENGIVASGIELYIHLGTEVQTAHPIIEAIMGAANTPAYRGLCYVVFHFTDLTKWGNRIPQFSFEVKRVKWWI